MAQQRGIWDDLEEALSAAIWIVLTCVAIVFVFFLLSTALKLGWGK